MQILQEKDNVPEKETKDAESCATNPYEEVKDYA